MKYVLAFFVGAWVLVTSAQAAGYRVETVTSGLEHPWSLAFLPGGRLLVTERPGRLRVIEPGPDGRLQLRPEPVAGVPAVLARGQAGLFDVVVDPAFAVNGRVLLSFAHGQTEANHLRVVRARFDGRQLLDVQPIFTSQPAKTETQHFGGRMAWMADGSLLLGMGDGNLDRTDAQRLHTHLGKLLRIQPDGSVPGDNPFLQRPNARPEIYSIGHRNPQGLVLAPDGTRTTMAPITRHIDNAMVKALARAFRWRHLLESGTYGTIDEIAKAEKINPSYVSRVLRMTLLAPVVVEAILDGRQRETITLARLMKDVPVVWKEQLYRT